MSESILSDELVNELSSGSGDVLFTQSKRKRSQKALPAEEEAEPQPLSKSARKKMEQLQMKKVKESKRSEYFKMISDHAISDNQRNLLISTKDMGQDSSNRKRLKLSISKQRAGIELSGSEKDLLFQKKRDTFPENLPVSQGPVNSCPLSFSSAADVAKNSGMDKDIGGLCKQHESSEPSRQTLSLLQQFESLKSKGKVSMSVAQDVSQPCSRDNVEPSLKQSVHRSPHLPAVTRIPINDMGRVTSTSTSSSQNSPYDSNGPRPLKSTRPPSLILNRDPAIQESRLQLPICGMEQEIVEAISSNDVIILCGETGSGKSTQVPQFLYENGFASTGLVGITQPRRVAVTSTASRVAVEMGCPLIDCGSRVEKHPARPKNLVGFQIRHDSSTLNTSMKIKFMTDGILLKEISSDILLKKYNVIILDEAHERNVNTDVLLGMLSRAIPLRKKQHLSETEEWRKLSEKDRINFEDPIAPLRLVIMSATLRVDDFLTKNLFSSIPPVIKVEARQYSVKTHFSKRTNMNEYMDEAFNKVCQIHKKLPPGGILVFLTGKREIMHMCHKLSKALNDQGGVSMFDDEDEDEDEDDVDGLLGCDEKEAVADRMFQNGDSLPPTAGTMTDTPNACDDISTNESGNASITVQTAQTVNSDGANGGDSVRNLFLEEAIGGKLSAVKNPSTGAPSNTEKSLLSSDISGDTVEERKVGMSLPIAATVLPLYALLAADKQKLVFREPPGGHRLIVVATNVAETSITIPGIRYVVDCGRQKERIIDVKSGISEYKVTWISKASANQRTGRAGRTGPGHCYRLYSSSYFHQHMIDFQEPEICTFPLEDLILQLRSIGIRNIKNFPFPTPPPMQSLFRAETLLTNLGALETLCDPYASGSKSALGAIDSILSSQKHNQFLGGGITVLGKNMSKFPIGARLAKMLLVAHKAGNVPMALCISVVVCLTERTIFNARYHVPAVSSDSNDSDDNSDGDDDNDESNTMGSLWIHPNSDILARVRAFGAFFYFLSDFRVSKGGRGEGEDKAGIMFCESRGLHYPSMVRCVHLYEQLHHICRVHLSGTSPLDSVDFGSLPPPSAPQETALRQILLTGYGDSVARRVPTGSNLFSAECSKRKKLTAYLSCDPSITAPLFIHPHSALFRKDPTAPLPEFLVYTELLLSEDGETTYMTGVTQISPNWISELTRDCPLLQLSSPLKVPSPFFDKKTDAIMCFISATYGIHKWELPVREVEMQYLKHNRAAAAAKTVNDDTMVYRWFGRLLLEGKVLSHVVGLKKLFAVENMQESPHKLTESSVSRKMEDFVRCLVHHNVHSLATLRAQISIDRNFLSAQIQTLLKVKVRSKFVLLWDKYSESL